MRYFLSMTAGVVAALLLFLLMHHLIRDGYGFHGSLDAGEVVAFIRIQKDETVVPKRSRLPEPPEPPEEPIAPSIEMKNPSEPERATIDADFPGIKGPGTGVGPYIAAGRNQSPPSEGDAIAVVKIEPQWPREAALNGIEGWVEVSFTILPDGSVANVEIVAAEPPRLFNNNTVRAVLKWKFKPRIVDGQPVARRASQRIAFKLSDLE